MFSFTASGRLHNPAVSGQEPGLAVAFAKWCKFSYLAACLQGQVPGCKISIDIHRRFIGSIRILKFIFFEALGKLSKVFDRHRNTSGLRMSAELLRKRLGKKNRLQDIISLARPRRTFQGTGLTGSFRKNNCRPIITGYKARCYNTDNTRMPVFSTHKNRACLCVHNRCPLFGIFQNGNSLIIYGQFDFLPACIFLGQRLCKPVRLFFIICH